MATMLPKCVTMAAKMARPCPETQSPVHERVYDTDLERGLPLQDMRPFPESPDGLRFRQSSSNLQHHEESPSTSSNFIPSSSATSSETTVPERSWPLKAFWESTSSRVKSTLFGPSVKEIKELNLKYGYNRFTNPNLDEYPKGFPKFAALIASDPDFSIFRGFKYCHSRLLAKYQIEITELEKELTQLDKADKTNPETKYRLRSTFFKEGFDTSQQDLLERLHNKLLRYDKLTLKYHQMQSIGKSSERNHRSLWHHIREWKPFDGGYYDFILHSDDFLQVGIRDSDPNFFEEWIQRYVNRHPKSIVKKLLKTDDERNKTSDPNINYYSPTRLRAMNKIARVFVAVAFLLIPVFLLFLVHMSRGAMAVTALSFVFLFSLVLSTMTPAKVHEVFFGTATYGAVLIVFLGAVNQGTLVVGGS